MEKLLLSYQPLLTTAGVAKWLGVSKRAVLKPDQLQGVADIYQIGPRAAGFNTDTWTTARFAEAILARFGVRYNPDHVGRIMHRLGLRERTRAPRRTEAPAYASRRYCPNTVVSRPEISPTVA